TPSSPQTPAQDSKKGQGQWRGQSIVVAQDGTGNYYTVKEALNASEWRVDANERFVIHVKKGVYYESLVVNERMKNVELRGDGMGITIISSHRSVGNHDGNLIQVGTIVISGDGFVARDITFENTAGVNSGQAPAAIVNANHAAFYRCGFKGYQDTLYAQLGLQFYKECHIYGTVDFICGDATAVFQNSRIYARKRSLIANEIVIAASQRNNETSMTGFVFQRCQLVPDADLEPVINSYLIYLGRPWGHFSRTVYMQNEFDIPVAADGWLEWEDRPGDTHYVEYREYDNRGIGASTDQRVTWNGYQVIFDPIEAEKYTVARFLYADTWLPALGVPYTPGL
ncbi:unnamed protein product, partial [Thlaspi arvense]